MNRRRLRIGPGAPSLLLIISVLCMSILGVLAFLNAYHDCQLSQRSIAVSEEVAQLNARAESSLARLDAVFHAHPEDLTQEMLPEGMTLDDGRVSWTETSGSRTLYCAAAVPTGDAPLCWLEHRLMTEFDSLGE